MLRYIVDHRQRRGEYKRLTILQLFSIHVYFFQKTVQLLKMSTLHHSISFINRQESRNTINDVKAQYSEYFRRYYLPNVVNLAQMQVALLNQFPQTTRRRDNYFRRLAQDSLLLDCSHSSYDDGDLQAKIKLKMTVFYYLL